jgi:hypothetical protein
LLCLYGQAKTVTILQDGISSRESTMSDMSEQDKAQQDNPTGESDEVAKDGVSADAPTDSAGTRTGKEKVAKKKEENRVIRLLEKNPLGMTLPEMAGGPRQLKKIKLLRPMLAEAIRAGQVMPISQRAGNTVYRLVKYMRTRSI